MIENGKSTKLDVSKVIFALALFLLGITLLLGFYLPLHVDEIDWSYSNHRAIQDHFSVITLIPQCQVPESYAKSLPFTWYPYAFINHMLFMQFDGLVWLRIVGSARFIMLLIAVGFILRGVSQHFAFTYRWMLVLFLSLMLLDYTPLLLQVNRPEQTIILSIVVLLALALNTDVIVDRPYRKYMAISILCLTLACVFPSHPKAIAALPVLLVSSGIFLTKIHCRRWVMVLTLSCIALYALQSILFWIARYDCPHSDFMKEYIGAHTLPMNLLPWHPIMFGQELIVVMAFAVIVKFIGIPVYWLPPSLTLFPYSLDDIALFYRPLTMIFKVSALAYCIVFLAKTMIFSLASIRRVRLAKDQVKNLSFLPLLACAATCSLLATILIVGRSSAFYHAILEIPLLYVSGLLCLAADGNGLRINNRIRFVALFIFVAAAGSVVLYASMYYPFITQPERRERVMKRDEDYSRTLLYSPFEYASQAKVIKAVYEECGFPPAESDASHMVLDPYTYPVLKRTFQPFALVYFIDGGEGEQLEEQVFLDRLREYHSDGVLARCDQIPNNYLSNFTQHHGYCCMRISP
jgi:hypothetical protein